MMVKRLLALAGLVAASLVCGGLLHVRELEAGSHHFHFLRWNLFLAWVPFLCAAAAYELDLRARRTPFVRTAALMFLALWLLFLPNAPYLMTDFIHLRQWDRVPLWFDTLLIGSFASTGLLLGLSSLVLVHTIVARRIGLVGGWLFALASLGFAAAGAYFGRIDHRWNSWDVLARPWAVLGDLWIHLRFPLDHLHAVAFMGLFAVFLILSYLALVAFNRRGLGITV
jgi:uncharacterized membrane protein